jgi:nucleoside-diphosphate-sugar epimerase
MNSTPKNNKVLILGNSGFIGRALEAYIKKYAVYSVKGYSLDDFDLTDFKSAKNLLTDFDSNTTLILTAAIKRQFSDTLESFQKNLNIVENVCKLQQQKPLKRIIFFSSAAVYGEETHNINISEKTLVNPTSFYGISKYSGECLLKKICKDSNLTSVINIRPPLIYGPSDSAGTYGPSGFILNASEGKEIILWGDGSELREFIFLDDICYILNFLIGSSFEGEVNIVSGKSYCFSDIIDILKDKGFDLKLSSKHRSKDKADHAFDGALLKSIMPKEFMFTTLKDGIQKSLEAVKK